MDDEIHHVPLIRPPNLYREAQERDGIDGDDYDGTTLRGAFKALQKHWGLIAEYRWLWSAEAVLEAIIRTGPVLIGMPWPQSMDHTDSEELLRPARTTEYAHAVLLNGANRDRAVVRGKNSWGEPWGDGGSFWLALEDLERLFDTGWSEARYCQMLWMRAQAALAV